MRIEVPPPLYIKSAHGFTLSFTLESVGRTASNGPWKYLHCNFQGDESCGSQDPFGQIHLCDSEWQIHLCDGEDKRTRDLDVTDVWWIVPYLTYVNTLLSRLITLTLYTQGLLNPVHNILEPLCVDVCTRNKDLLSRYFTSPSPIWRNFLWWVNCSQGSS